MRLITRAWLMACMLLVSIAASQGQAPFFSKQPTNQYAAIRFGASFIVLAGGSTPLSYQWQFNGANLSGATNSTLALTNLAYADSGQYRVVVTNSLGTNVTTNATLVVGNAVSWGIFNATNIPLSATNLTTALATWAFSLGLKSDGTVIEWGSSPPPIPPGIINVKSIAVGYQHAMGLRADGTVIAWGNNTYGQTNVPANLSNVVQIAAGGSYSLAMRQDGSIVIWGAQNAFQQNFAPVGLRAISLGAGDGYCAALTSGGTVVAWGLASEVNVPAGLSNVIAISAGYSHTLALKADGTLAAWGKSSYGQTNIPPQATNVVAISAGMSFDLALRGDGSIVAWGDNSWHQTNPPPNLQYSVSVSAGDVHAVGLCNSGEPALTVQPASQIAIADDPVTLFSKAIGSQPIATQWQYSGVDIANATNANLSLGLIQQEQGGSYTVVYSNALAVVTSQVAVVTVRPRPSLAVWGTLGPALGTPTPNLSNIIDVAGSAALLNDGKVVPWSTGYTNIAVPPNVSNVVALESGLGSQYLALRNDGTLISWGNPTLPLFFDRFIAIACGTFHNLAVRTDGIVYSWGGSPSLGNNVPAGLSGVIAVAAGYNHSLALKSDGTVIAWGGNISVPTNGPAGLSNIIAIACGEYHALALHNDGRVSAWGGLGRGETNVPPDLTNAIAISALSGHSLALRDDGTVVAWGYNFDGQCNVPHGLTNVVKIRAGGKTSLALTGVKNPLITAEPRGLTTPTGTTARLGVWSAGYLPESYQWSHGGADIPGATGPSLSVTNVQLSDQGCYSVSISNSYGVVTSSCAGLTLGPIMEWGLTDGWGLAAPSGLANLKAIAGNAWQSLAIRGDGSVASWDFDSGIFPQGLSNVVNLVDGPRATFAVRDDGAVLEWSRFNGFLKPLPSPLPAIKQVAVGQDHIVALKRDGTILSWFFDSIPWNQGQTNVPDGLSNVVAVGAGDYHSLALRADGTVISWGSQSSVPADLSNVVAIAASSSHNMALISDGTVVTWGGISVPAGLSNVVSIGTGPATDLACLADGSLVIWGYYLWNGGTIPPGLVNVYSAAAGFNQILVMTGDGSPMITVQPFDQSVLAAGTATFQVMASGSQSLGYQWQYNSSPISGATKSILTLTNIALYAAGSYRCIVTNLLGSATSDSAVLTVRQSPIRFDNSAGLTVSNGVAKIRLTGLSGSGNVVLYCSTNLIDWTPVFTNPPTLGAWEYQETVTNSPVKFFRASETR